jgi:hypothetical protein
MDNIQSAIDSKGAGVFNQAELFFDDLFLKKLPPLPEQIRDLLVKLAPFWAILLIVFAVLQIVLGSLLVLLGLLGTILSIATLSGSSVISSVLGIVQSVVGLALGAVILIYLAKSVKGLFDHKNVGWQSLFRAEMVGVAYAVFSVVIGALISVMSLSGMGVIMGIGSAIIAIPIQLIFFGLAFYLLFQIKDRYVGVKA